MRAVVLDGIVLGLQFGLLGVGMTLVYGLGGVLNLSYGQAAVLAAMVVALSLAAGVPALVAAGAGLLVAAAGGVVLDRTLMQPVYRQRGEHRVLLGLLLTLGVAFVIISAGYLVLSERGPAPGGGRRGGADLRRPHAGWEACGPRASRWWWAPPCCCSSAAPPWGGPPAR